MSSPLSIVRAYRILAACAILHALLITLWLILSWPAFPWNNQWISGPGAPNLWFAFATLWLFWPVILSLHTGRSFARGVIAISVALLVLYPAFGEYDSLAPRIFGLPEDIVSLSPRYMWQYYAAYRVGRKEAGNDLKSGHLVHEQFGLAMPPQFEQILRDRYQVEVKQTASCIVNEKILGHARGYNDVSDAELKRRFDVDVVRVAEEQAFKEWNAQQSK